MTASTTPQLPDGMIDALLEMDNVQTILARVWQEHKSDIPFEELARDVALTRSALAERFTATIGEPPMQYLTRWAAHARGSGAARPQRQHGHACRSSVTESW